MITEIKLFLFVLSCVYTLRFIVEFIVKLFEENPSVLKVSKINQSLLYFTVSYIITYFLI